MNLNARDIVVEHIGSRFFMSLFTNEDSGSKIEYKNCLILRMVPVVNNLFFNLLYNGGQSCSVFGDLSSDIKPKELAL